MPRPRKAGDKATVARKRYYRAAERYLKQAENMTGATAARYRQLAKTELDNALKTYDPTTTQKFAKPIQKIANDLGVSLEDERRKMKDMGRGMREKMRESAIEIGEGSKSAKSLAGAFEDVDVRSEAEARAIINSPIGSRIIGGTVDIWKDAATVTRDVDGKLIDEIDKTKIIPALMKYYNADTLSELIETIENEIGESLYADADSEAMYEAVKISLQARIISDNMLVI